MVTNSVRRDRPRILVLADDCNPYWHSLPALVYSALSALSKYVDLVVVTQIRNRPNIDQTGLGSAEVVYVDTEIIAGPLHRLASFLSRDANKGMTLKVALNYPSYLAFEWAAWRRFRKELMNGAFDVVHRFSPMSPTIPSPIASWSPVPFVIGPILGGLRASRARPCPRCFAWWTRSRPLAKAGGFTPPDPRGGICATMMTRAG